MARAPRCLFGLVACYSGACACPTRQDPGLKRQCTRSVPLPEAVKPGAATLDRFHRDTATAHKILEVAAPSFPSITVAHRLGFKPCSRDSVEGRAP